MSATPEPFDLTAVKDHFEAAQAAAATDPAAAVHAAAKTAVTIVHGTGRGVLTNLKVLTLGALSYALALAWTAFFGLTLLDTDTISAAVLVSGAACIGVVVWADFVWRRSSKNDQLRLQSHDTAVIMLGDGYSEAATVDLLSLASQLGELPSDVHRQAMSLNGSI
jgi:hypothetical protein